MQVEQNEAEQTSRSPFLSRSFRLIWGGQFVSAAGDQLFPLAMIGLALDEPDAATSVGLILAARFTALAIFIVLGGVLADRFDRLRLMVTFDVARAIAVATLVMVGADAPMILVVAVTFALGAGEALFQPTADAVVPQVVGADQLKRANAALNVLQSSARVVGPVVGGLLVGSIGATSTLGIDLATFLISALAILMIRREDLGAAEAPDGDETPSMLRQALDGVRVVLGLRWLAALEGMAIVHTLLAVGPWMVILPLFAERELGGIDRYGLLIALFFAGGIPGSAFAGRVHSARPGLWALAGISTFGVALAAMAMTSSLPVLGAAFLVAGFGTQFFDVLKVTAIQEQVDDSALGRVFSLDFFASFVTMPLGQLAGAALLTTGNISSLLWASAAVIFISTPLVLFVPGMVRLRNDDLAIASEDQTNA